jgi:cytochrome c556
VAACAGLLIALSVMFACSPSKSSPPASGTPAAATPPSLPAPQLWGDVKPVVSVKELMRDMLDPAADNIFDAVKIVYTTSGTVETSPKTEQDWEKIRIGAVTLAEGVYLLKIPRPFAPPGDENNSKGPDATELSPAQITAKLEADPVLWNAKIEALRNVGLEVLEIVKQKKVDELWDAGHNLDQACESCHLQYWYPGDTALLQRLDRDIQKRHEQSQRAGKTGRGR